MTKKYEGLNGVIFYSPSERDLTIMHLDDELLSNADNYLKDLGFNPKKFRGVPTDLAKSYCFDMESGFPKSHFIPELKKLVRTYKFNLEVLTNDKYKLFQELILSKYQLF